MTNILVTGGAGFIGSNFIRLLLEKPGISVVNLDALTYAGNLENLQGCEGAAGYHFIKGSICNADLVNKTLREYNIDTVVNFAAESHVDRSIENSRAFLETNIGGTHTLLESAKAYWSQAPEDKYSCDYRLGVRFVQVSTDEVYGSLGKTGFFSETTPLAPNSPYSASKASADMFVRAYGETFGLPVNITRCSNNYGPYQFPEKLIPLMIHNCRIGRKMPVYGNGMQIRDWLHVKDHCSALLAVIQNGKAGETYNIGGNNEKTNIDIVKLILSYTGKSENLIEYVRDRPGHDKRYAIDNSKITAELGWKPAIAFEKGLRETIDWYMDNESWLKRIVNGDYSDYYEKMYGCGGFAAK